MRLVSFRDGTATRAGVQFGTTIYDTGKSMTELLEEWPVAKTRLPRSESQVKDRRHVIASSDVLLSAPTPSPGKVVGIGLNYHDHCREQGIEPPKAPLIFAKFTSSIIGPGESIRWPEGLTQQVDWEVELAVVIGRSPRGALGDNLSDVVAGYMVANDISARDLQFSDGQFVRGKSLDTFCPLGPALVTADSLSPDSLALTLQVNGQMRQNSNTADLVFGVKSLIEYCSKSFSLLPGDVLLTGTPAGVGAFRRPPVYLTAGDVMTAWVEGIGELVNPVVGSAPTG